MYSGKECLSAIDKNVCGVAFGQRVRVYNSACWAEVAEGRGALSVTSREAVIANTA